MKKTISRNSHKKKNKNIAKSDRRTYKIFTYLSRLAEIIYTIYIILQIFFK